MKYRQEKYKNIAKRIIALITIYRYFQFITVKKVLYIFMKNYLEFYEFLNLHYTNKNNEIKIITIYYSF